MSTMRKYIRKVSNKGWRRHPDVHDKIVEFMTEVFVDGSPRILEQGTKEPVSKKPNHWFCIYICAHAKEIHCRAFCSKGEVDFKYMLEKISPGLWLFSGFQVKYTSFTIRSEYWVQMEFDTASGRIILMSKPFLVVSHESQRGRPEIFQRALNSEKDTPYDPPRKTHTWPVVDVPPKTSKKRKSPEEPVQKKAKYVESIETTIGTLWLDFPEIPIIHSWSSKGLESSSQELDQHFGHLPLENALPELDLSQPLFDTTV